MTNHEKLIRYHMRDARNALALASKALKAGALMGARTLLLIAVNNAKRAADETGQMYRSSKK